MNRIRSISRFACLLAELALAGRNLLTKAAKSRARHRIALAAAIVGPVAPLAAALPATAASAEGKAPPDMVTQWNLTMIAGLEAAAIPAAASCADRGDRPGVGVRRGQRDRAAVRLLSRHPPVLPAPPPRPVRHTPRWSP